MPRILKKQNLKKSAESDILEIQNELNASLCSFAHVMMPNMAWGECHKEAFEFFQNPRTKKKLLMYPRDHLKSKMLAVMVCWFIAKDPTITIMYISATAGLAELQLYQIKQILESQRFKNIYPHLRTNQTSKWNNSEIVVESAERDAAFVRDSTVTTAGVDKNITGKHPNIIFMDDVVILENSQTDDQRSALKTKVSLFSSIESGDAKTFVVGTPYHYDDLYKDLIEMEHNVYDENNVLIETRKMYDVVIRQVEVNGQFLWPRSKGPDGNYYGWDSNLLSVKQAGYLDKGLFMAQYYCDPSLIGNQAINRDYFEYFDPKYIKIESTGVYYKNEELSLCAGIDFAFSIRKKADFSCIAVIGKNCDNKVYLLDLYKFKTKDIDVYFDEIVYLFNKWRFRDLAAEVSAAQNAIVDFLKKRISAAGIGLRVIPVRPTKADGHKHIRVMNILSPYYVNHLIVHPSGGLANDYELELAGKSKHDDVVDAVSIAVANCKTPIKRVTRSFGQQKVYSSTGRFLGYRQLNNGEINVQQFDFSLPRNWNNRT